MMASRMMSDLDPDNTGKITKDQFISGLTAKGVSSADATKMYNSIDTKGIGSISKSDIEAAIKNGNLKPPAGAPPGGPDGAEKSGSASGSSTNYAAADTNKDGVVSAQEALVYVMQHLAGTTHDSTKHDSTKIDPTKLGGNVDEMA